MLLTLPLLLLLPLALGTSGDVDTPPPTFPRFAVASVASLAASAAARNLLVPLLPLPGRYHAGCVFLLDAFLGVGYRSRVGHPTDM
jgi:hypothetical protein